MQKRIQRAPSPAHSLSMGSHLARAAGRSAHGLRPEARSYVAWLLRLVAGDRRVDIARIVD